MSLSSFRYNISLTLNEYRAFENILQMIYDLSCNFVVSIQRSIWELHENCLGLSAISLLVENLLCMRDIDLDQEIFQFVVLHFEVEKTFSDFFFELGRLLIILLYDSISSVEHILFLN